MTSMRHGHRVAIVSPAHAMTPGAQNALLKTLEEPSAGTLIVLVTARPSGLLATLRSRCQRVEIARPARGLALEWLARELPGAATPRLLDLASGAPMRAAALAHHFASLESQMTGLLDDLLSGRSEVTRTSAEMMGEGLAGRLDWLEAWLGTALRRRTLPDATGLTIRGGPLLQRAAAEVNISAAFRMVDRLREATVPVPEGVEVGDLLAILDTGAYQEVSASNFNALPRPATVLLSGGQAEVVRRGETEEDVFRRDVVPERLGRPLARA